MIQINVLDEPKQKFSVILNGRRVTFLLWYNVTSDRWTFDLAVDGEPVLNGRKIVTGVDLLAPFAFGLGILFALAENDEEPGRDQLPSGRVRLYHTTQEEVDAAISA